MRVLHVLPAVARVYGGPSQLVPELARALSRAGVAVDIATTDADGSERLPVPLEVPVNRAGVATYFFPRQRPSGYTFSWPLTRWLWQHVDQYDLVHITAVFSYPTLAAGRLATLRRRPFIVAPQGMLEPWSMRRKVWKKRPYFHLVERPTLARAAAIQALVEEEARRIRALRLVPPVFVLPNGVDPEEFQHLPSRDVFDAAYPEARGKRLILFLGRLDPKKGLDLLVRAFGRLTASTGLGESLRLVIAGPDLVGYRSKLEALIAKERLGNRVIFAGMLSGANKRAALASAEMFVLPSYSEGFSVAVLEALAAGLPVVITENCNFPEVARHGAGFVVPPAAEAIAEAMSQILLAEQTRRAMRGLARRLVQDHFAWPAIARRLVGIYEDLIRGARTSAAWQA